MDHPLGIASRLTVAGLENWEKAGPAGGRTRTSISV